MPLKETIWRGIRIALPEEWELLQYSRKQDKGKLAFADRFQFRCEVHWQRMEKEPDVQRIRDDYASELKAMEDAKKVATCQIGSWQGVRFRYNKVGHVRYACYLEPLTYLVEVALIWPQEREEVLEQQLIQSVGVSLPEHGDLRWKAMGLDLRVPETYELEQCRVAPADAQFEFSTGARRLHFQRVGFLTHRLGEGSPMDWVQHRVPDLVKKLQFKQEKSWIAGQGKWKTPGYLKPDLNYRIAAQVCDTCGRLLLFEEVYAKDPVGGLERVSCCEKKR